MLLRALSRLAKGGCPGYLLIAEMTAHADVFSLPTLVSTATALSVDASVEGALKGQAVVRSAKREASHQPLDAATRAEIVAMLRPLIELRLRGLETPLKGRRVYLDTAGISLVGSLLRPNEVGDTGTAWQPAGIAFDLPAKALYIDHVLDEVQELGRQLELSPVLHPDDPRHLKPPPAAVFRFPER